MSEENFTLRVISYNCNALKYIARRRVEKIHAIADYLAVGAFDIVCLQEIWVADDYEYLKARCRAHLPFSHWYINPSAVGSCGLVTMSKWPIHVVHLHQFRLQGNPYKFYNGDWFCGKSIGYARITLGPGKQPLTLHIFNTHLLANYGTPSCPEDKLSQYAVHRLTQAYEVAHYVQTMCGSTSKADSLLFVMGDFNTEITELGYDVIQSRLSVFDCNPCLPACICYSTNRSLLEVKSACPRAGKIDHIFLRIGSNLVSTIDVFKDEGRDSVGRPMSDHEPRIIQLHLHRGASGINEAQSKDAAVGRRVQGNCSQTGCLKTMRKHLVTYLGSQSYRCSLFALLLNFICMIAFSVTVFLAQPSPFEASLLTLLYLGLLYIVCTLKVLTIDAEWKGIQRMLACIQLDLSRYNRHSVLILENDVKDGEL